MWIEGRLSYACADIEHNSLWKDWGNVCKVNKCMAQVVMCHACRSWDNDSTVRDAVACNSSAVPI